MWQNSEYWKFLSSSQQLLKSINHMINQSYDPMISKYLHFIVDNIFYNDYSYNIDHYRYLFYENGNVFGKV